MTKAQFLKNCQQLMTKGVAKSFLAQCYDGIVKHEIKGCFVRVYVWVCVGMCWCVGVIVVQLQFNHARTHARQTLTFGLCASVFSMIRE